MWADGTDDIDRAAVELDILLKRTLERAREPRRRPPRRHGGRSRPRSSPDPPVGARVSRAVAAPAPSPLERSVTSHDEAWDGEPADGDGAPLLRSASSAFLASRFVPRLRRLILSAYAAPALSRLAPAACHA